MVKTCLAFLNQKQYQVPDAMALFDQRLLLVEKLFSDLLALHPVTLKGVLTGYNSFLVYGCVLSCTSFDDIIADITAHQDDSALLKYNFSLNVANGGGAEAMRTHGKLMSKDELAAAKAANKQSAAAAQAAAATAAAQAAAEA
jgi:hypothetical protein